MSVSTAISTVISTITNSTVVTTTLIWAGSPTTLRTTIYNNAASSSVVVVTTTIYSNSPTSTSPVNPQPAWGPGVSPAKIVAITLGVLLFAILVGIGSRYIKSRCIRSRRNNTTSPTKQSSNDHSSTQTGHSDAASHTTLAGPKN